MKTFLRVFLLFVAVDLVAVAQAPDNLAPQKHQVAGIRLTSIMGTVRAGGEKLMFKSLECGQSGDP
jgi:hypothetical protein